MGEPAKKLDKVYTYADYLTWDDDERWEIIEGVAYKMVFGMSPAPSRFHQDILGELHLQIGSFLMDKQCKVYISPFDVSLPEADKADNEIKTVVQPDIAVICDESKLTEKGCTGAPDLIIEILSPSSASRDLIVKQKLYEKHKVKVYWIVDPTHKTVMIFKIEDNDQYGKPEIYASEDKINVELLEGLTIDLTKVFKEN